MKKVIPFLSLIFTFTSNLYAQLNVENDSYVFVKGTYLYVKDNINLESTGLIYLRDESQLLQGSTGASTNSGTGKISLYQEGNATQYTYNYWCSPVGTPTSAIGNVPFFPLATGTINDSISLTSSTPATFTSGYNGTSSPLQISRMWLYEYKPGVNYADWIYIGQSNGSGFTNPGFGFSMKGTNVANHKQRYDFRGRPNDGNIQINLMDGQETLTGNPYPSAIDLAAVLLDSDNVGKIEGSVSYWEHDLSVTSHNVADYRGGYGVWVPDCDNLEDCGKGQYTKATYNSYDNYGNYVSTGALSVNNFEGRRFAPVGQGFMVKGIVDNEMLTFKNEHRVFYREDDAQYSVFNKESNPYGHDNTTSTPNNVGEVVFNNGAGTLDVSNTFERPKYIFQIVVNDTYTRDLMLTINNNCSIGYDYGFDGLSASDLSTDAAFDINNNDYFIQSTAFSADEMIPLHFKTGGTSASFKIHIGAYINIDPAQQVFVYDNFLDEYHLISDTDEFTFSTAETSVNNRYYITFTSTPLSTEPVLNNSTVLVYQDNNVQSLNIKNPNLFEIEAVSLYNMAGQQIFVKSDLGATDNYSFNTSNLTTGVYVVSITANNSQLITKKVTIKN